MDFEEIREKVLKGIDIVEVISEYLPLKKQGNSYSTNCPFHPDDTPSLFVSPSRGIWKCFGCGKGGDAIKFVAEIENISYGEALRKLASRVGIEIGDKKADRTSVALERLVKHYRENLLKHKEAKQYLLRERGLPPSVISEFEIGYADGNKAVEFAKKEGILEELERLGHIRKKFGYYDFLRNRVVIPIRDFKRKVVGFAGRLLKEDKNSPKYLHTPYFKKSEYLFGFNSESLQYAKEKGFVILVEGIFDAIRLHSLGFKNTFAVFGTELSETQIKILLWLRKKHGVDRVLLAFDNDDAGKRAIFKTLKKLFSKGFEGVYHLTYDFEEKDLDEFGKKHGLKGLKELIEKSLQEPSVYRLAYRISKMERPEQIAKWVRRLQEAIYSHPSKVVADKIWRIARKKIEGFNVIPTSKREKREGYKLSELEKAFLTGVERGLVEDAYRDLVFEAFPELKEAFESGNFERKGDETLIEIAKEEMIRRVSIKYGTEMGVEKPKPFLRRKRRKMG